MHKETIGLIGIGLVGSVLAEKLLEKEVMEVEEIRILLGLAKDKETKPEAAV